VPGRVYGVCSVGDRRRLNWWLEGAHDWPSAGAGARHWCWKLRVGFGGGSQVLCCVSFGGALLCFLCKKQQCTSSHSMSLLFCVLLCCPESRQHVLWRAVCCPQVLGHAHPHMGQ
jgi:hypothetical protein